MRKIKLPFIPEITIGKTVQEDLVPQVVAVENKNTEKTYDVLGGLLSFSQHTLSDEKRISKKILEANKEWVYRNNDVIAQEVSKIKFELFSINISKGEIVYIPIDEHPLLDILDKFNARTTKSDGIYMTQSHKKLTGDAFWLLDRTSGGVVENIYILAPDKMELVLDSPTASSDDLVKAYLYTDVIDGKKVKEEYTPDQVIHFKKPNPKNPFRGYGAVEALADTIDADNLTNDVQSNFFKKGAISNFVLTTENKVTQDQLKRIKAEMRVYQGAQNAFSTMIFGNGLKPAEIGFSNKDMQFLDLLEWYRDKIMIGFGNTKASIGIVDDVNRASYEGSYVGWLRSTVKPDMDSIVGTLNEFLVPLFGENLVLGYEDPIQKDITDDVTHAVELKEAGIITINESREMVNLEPVDGGDMFATPGSVNTQDPDKEDVLSEEDTTNDEKTVKLKKKQLGTVPDSLKSVDIKAVLRRRKSYNMLNKNKNVKEFAKPIIEQMLKNKRAKKSTNAQKDEVKLTLEQMSQYYDIQTKIEDLYEEKFQKKVFALLTEVKNQAINNLSSEIGTIKALKRFIVNKELFDEQALKTQALIDLTPILSQELVAAGQEAYRLIGIEDTYVPYEAQDAVRGIIDKFADSMYDTDKKQLTKIILDGIDAGKTINEIAEAINSKFGQYTKAQAEAIARTETSRVSNLAARDAFMQSGVVESVQWLVAPGACPKCLPYKDVVVKLDSKFYEPDNSGFQDGDPPLHVRCRCKIIPADIVELSIGDLSTKVIEQQQKTIEELEEQIDKRTKGYKEIKEAKLEDEAYIKALEKYLGVSDSE